MLWKKPIGIACGVALGIAMVAAAQQPPAPAPVAPGGRGPGGGRGGNAGRFKFYPAASIERGGKAYDATCGYCHGARGKGGQVGPDLIRSLVTLHDEDGVQIGEFLKGAKHQSDAKLDLASVPVTDIASYLHSRVVYAAGRGDVHLDQVLVGDAKAGEAYFRGAGKCVSCHSPTGDLKGIGDKYDAATLQDRLVMPRAGRGGRGGPGGRGGNPNAIKATVTLPSGETVKGDLVQLTDFDVIVRLSDGTFKSFTRNHGVPKVETTDPLQAHLDLMRTLNDTDMHNLTAYLATLK